jgi:hypothetical protein
MIKLAAFLKKKEDKQYYATAIMGIIQLKG